MSPLVDELTIECEIAERRAERERWLAQGTQMKALRQDAPASHAQRRPITQWLGDHLVAVGERLRAGTVSP